MGYFIKFLLWFFPLMRLVGARVHVFHWDVRRELRSPDSYDKQVVTINGESPGPTIQVQRGDIVFVRGTNHLTEKFAIHWDGTRLIESPGSGGISPGETFTYGFSPSRFGKSLYYSYYRRQTVDGLHGLIDVTGPYGMADPSAYDYDRSIILDDQYYKINNDCEAEREYLLIPRKGKFDYFESTTPSSHPMACNANNPEFSHLRVVLGETYHLGISSLTAHSTLSFQIERHNFTVVEVEGHYVEPFVNQSLIVYPGKIYSIKIKANQDPSRDYPITTNIVGLNTTAVAPLGLAVLSYSSPTGPIRNGIAQQSVQSQGNKACQGYAIMLAILLASVADQRLLIKSVGDLLL